MADKKDEEKKKPWLLLVALIAAALLIGFVLKQSNSGAHSHDGGEAHSH